MRTSDISGFYKLSPAERLTAVKAFSGLTDEEAFALSVEGSLKMADANRMIENVVGTMPVPIGVAVNFRINDHDYLIPMALEEPSVVAAASNAAKLARAKGGFHTSSTGPYMIGQIQVTHMPDPYNARQVIQQHKARVLDICNEKDPVLVRFGGGARDIECRVIQTSRGPMLIVHLIVDCRDAMGANAVNTMVETVAPYIAQLTGGRVFLRIISNLAVKRLARAKGGVGRGGVGGGGGEERALGG